MSRTAVVMGFLAWCLVVSLSGCPKSGGGSGGCELVTQGNSRVVIENRLATGVTAYFPDLAFEALIRPGKCEIFGMPDGGREVDLTQCIFASDSVCNEFGPTVRIDLPLAPGEERRIDVTTALF